MDFHKNVIPVDGARNPLLTNPPVTGIYEALMKSYKTWEMLPISTAGRISEPSINVCSQVMSTFASRVVQECLKKPVWPLAEATVFR